MSPEPKIPTAIEGIEKVTLGGSSNTENEDKSSEEAIVEAENLFKNTDENRDNPPQ